MEVRSLIGAYAGQVRDFPPHVAKELLASGRAVPVEMEMTTVAQEPSEVTATAPEASIKRVVNTPPKKGKGR